MKYFVTLISFVVIFSTNISAQSVIYNISEYMQANAVTNNPSAGVNATYNSDVSILGISGELSNNFFRYAKGSLPDPNFSLKSLRDRYSIDKSHNGYGNLDFTVVAFNKVEKKHAYGFNFRFRSYLSINNAAGHFLKFMKEGFSYFPLHNKRHTAKHYSIKSMSWAELSFNYGTILLQQGNNIITGGVNLKTLFGYHLASFIFNDIDYQVGSKDVEINNFNGKYALSTPYKRPNGGGLGIDLGVTYKHTLQNVRYHVPHDRLSNCKIPDYDYKLGISLVDFGSIKYKRRTRLREFQNVQQTWSDYQASNVRTFNLADNSILEEFGFNNSDIIYDTVTKAKLPTGVIIDYDYKMLPFIGLSAVAAIGLNSKKNLGADRGNSLVLSARYTTDKLEAIVPMTLHRYVPPQIGLYLRTTVFLLGTPNLIGLLTNDPQQLGITAGIRFPIKYTSYCAKRIRERSWWCPGCK